MGRVADGPGISGPFGTLKMLDLQGNWTDILLYIAGAVLLFNLYASLDIIIGTRRMRDLGAIRPFTGKTPPLVSVIVPACNEEETIRPALLSLLNQDYGPLEIIVINDRSTDRTGEVLAGIKKEYPQLRIHNVSVLPSGWLGKNHALQRGAELADGEYLLFTDADIRFEPTTLSRAMNLMLDEKLDHLSLIFKNITSGLLLNAMMIDAGGGLFFLFKPWKVSDPASRHFVGVGAFNLVRKSVYSATGGHEEIRMHPIDDIMLGKIIKKNGYRQECLAGYDFLEVPWYDSPKTMIAGLMKNIFALYNFSIPLGLAAVLFIFLVAVLPFWGMLLGSGLTRIFCAFAVAVRMLSATFGAKLTGSSLGTVPFYLLTPYINIYIILKGMIKTIADDGIVWRGTHYPLQLLRRNKRLL